MPDLSLQSVDFTSNCDQGFEGKCPLLYLLMDLLAMNFIPVLKSASCSNKFKKLIAHTVRKYFFISFHLFQAHLLLFSLCVFCC